MRRSGIRIMAKLIGLIRPLMHVVLAAIVMGVAGFLCSIFIPVLGGFAALQVLGFETSISLKTIGIVMILCGVFRGILRYAEQASNHYIAFKILAIIRKKVFHALRRLTPAKLEGRDKGNLVSLITSDIELLEVFYAHTISPIIIAIVTSLIMIAFIGRYHIGLGVFAAVAYGIIGFLLPMMNSKRGKEDGFAYRNKFGELNSFILDSLRGMGESLQYSVGEERLEEMNRKSQDMDKEFKKLKQHEGMNSALTDASVLLCSIGMLFLSLTFYRNGAIELSGVVIPVIAMMSSFGPVIALSNLSNNLLQTLACGNRVLDLLEEEPQVEEVTGKEEIGYEGAKVDNVTFSYEDELILGNCSMNFSKNQIIGINGKSGSGKSTLLKLMMRFFEVKHGVVLVSDKNVNEINTSNLRDMQGYVTQETYLFHDTIYNNIAFVKDGVSREEVEEACKKASIHEFIMSLPNGYQSQVGELGDCLSGGEKQRIGIARAFLHDAPMILLDEPTSNLDSLNEGIILKSLKEECANKTVVLVSHRKSTMNVADVVMKMETDRVS